MIIDREFSREKMGIQPVTTVVLLITVLLIAGGVIYMWMMIVGTMGHSIYIQTVNFEEFRTNIYVQNIGNGTVTIDSVHINDEKFNIYPTNCTVASEKTTTIKEGQTAEITIDRAYEEKVHIKVVCQDGTFHEADWRPPS